MTWCPICKCTYDNDETYCLDCDVSLISGSEEDYTEIFFDKSEETVLKIFKCLQENDIQSVDYYFNPKEKVYKILVTSDEAELAKQIAVNSIRAELSKDLSPSEQEAIDYQLKEMFIDSSNKVVESTVFISANEKYKELSSSASSLLVVGIIGYIVLILHKLGLFSVNMTKTAYVLFFSSMVIIFGIFIIMGIYTYSKAKKMKSNISNEETFIDTINNYILNNIDVEESNKNCTDDITEEEKYIIRLEYIKSKVFEKFKDLDEALADTLIEKNYNTLYPESVEFFEN